MEELYQIDGMVDARDYISPLEYIVPERNEDTALND